RRGGVKSGWRRLHRQAAIAEADLHGDVPGVEAVHAKRQAALTEPDFSGRRSGCGRTREGDTAYREIHIEAVPYRADKFGDEVIEAGNMRGTGADLARLVAFRQRLNFFPVGGGAVEVVVNDINDRFNFGDLRLAAVGGREVQAAGGKAQGAGPFAV